MSQQSLEPFLDFFLYEQGVFVEVNGTMHKALIKNTTESIQYYNDKYLFGKFEIQTGDYVKIVDRNDTYLVVSDIDKRTNHNKVRLKKCNQILVKEKPGEKVIIGYDDFGRPIYSTSAPIFISYLSIVENTVLDIETGYPIVVPENELVALVHESDETLQEFSLGEVFTVLNKTYQVIGIDRFKTGLLYIKAARN
ncbi:hypothetical protein PGC35_14185 [Psychrobacillus sp. PGGUH221]|uniref:hypothetical protein n=1 Tax=Psychrobacillus sp. PGGUH221 TaxID=3020058 RepID=UPI0035C76D47